MTQQVNIMVDKKVVNWLDIGLGVKVNKNALHNMSFAFFASKGLFYIFQIAHIYQLSFE